MRRTTATNRWFAAVFHAKFLLFMKQTILRYGFLSGAVAAVLMVATASLMDFETGAYYGYAGILLSMLFVYFGVRSYREQVGEGSLTFGKGFQIGILIAIVSCVCYVLTWMLVSETLMPDFLEKYIAHTQLKLEQSGTAPAEIDRQMAEMKHYQEMYKNPLLKFGLTFLEPFPVGFLMALISAIVLRKSK